jgi:hypothetical protein
LKISRSEENAEISFSLGNSLLTMWHGGAGTNIRHHRSNHHINAEHQFTIRHYPNHGWHFSPERNDYSNSWSVHWPGKQHGKPDTGRIHGSEFERYRDSGSFGQHGCTRFHSCRKHGSVLHTNEFIG